MRRAASHAGVDGGEVPHAVQVLLGEGAGVVLDGQKVLPAKAEKEGYSFQYPDVSSAVRNILR